MQGSERKETVRSVGLSGVRLAATELEESKLCKPGSSGHGNPQPQEAASGLVLAYAVLSGTERAPSASSCHLSLEGFVWSKQF